MEKLVRSNIYKHVDECIKRMQELTQLWVATQKDSSLLVDNQKEWSGKLQNLDDTAALIFEIFQKKIKGTKYESVTKMLLELIQDLTDFIKANRLLRVDMDKQLQAIAKLLKELSFFEKKFEQHINVLV